MEGRGACVHSSTVIVLTVVCLFVVIGLVVFAWVGLRRKVKVKVAK